MSIDYVVFDPTGLDTLPSKEKLQDWIHTCVGDGQESQVDLATERISELLDWASEKYGTAVNDTSHWTSWPPSLLANGRHCTFNLCTSADSMTFMMVLCDQCKRLGLLMIDPSGNNPFITVPGGGGLLD